MKKLIMIMTLSLIIGIALAQDGYMSRYAEVYHFKTCHFMIEGDMLAISYTGPLESGSPVYLYKVDFYEHENDLGTYTVVRYKERDLIIFIYIPDNPQQEWPREGAIKTIEGIDQSIEPVEIDMTLLPRKYLPFSFQTSDYE